MLKQHPGVLWILLGVALVFGLLVYYRPGLSGNDNVYGLGGVFLGLFIAAFPAVIFWSCFLPSWAICAGVRSNGPTCPSSSHLASRDDALPAA